MNGNRSHLRLLCCIAGLALFSGGVPAQEWKKFTYAEDGFEAEFSGPVKIYPTDLSPETKRVVVRSTNYLQDMADDAYIIGATTYVMDEVRFEEGAQGSFAAMKCSNMDYERPLPSGGARAKEMGATGCGDGSFSAIARYFNVGSRFYQVLAVFKTAGGGGAAARRFVESFALLPR